MITSHFKLVSAIVLLTIAASAQETTITHLKLRGDADAGGYLITNLSPSFAASAGLVAATNFDNATNNLQGQIDAIIFSNAAPIEAAVRADMTNIADAVVAAATSALAIAISADLTSATGAIASAVCAGGYTITNWWSPVITPVFRSVSTPIAETTNGYLIYATATSTSALQDYLLDYRITVGWFAPPVWTISTTNAYIASNRVWAVSPGTTTLSGVSDGVTRTATLPIFYSRVGQPSTALARLLPGSAADLASAPIIAMASNYLASSTEPLWERPNSWNTNELARTNYAAVATWSNPVAWNPECWLTNAAAVFAPTAIATGADPTASPRWHGTLISPSIILHARHTGSQVGTIKWFLTPNGSLTNATVLRQIDPWAATDPKPDFLLSVLSVPMPSNMVARVATLAQFSEAFGTAEYVQGVSFNQHLDASLFELSSVSAYGCSIRQPSLPAAAPLTSLYHSAHPGDSGRPMFMLWGSTPVLLSTYWYTPFGSSVSAHLTAIQTAVLAEGEALIYVDFDIAP